MLMGDSTMSGAVTRESQGPGLWKTASPSEALNDDQSVADGEGLCFGYKSKLENVALASGFAGCLRPLSPNRMAHVHLEFSSDLQIAQLANDSVADTLTLFYFGLWGCNANEILTRLQSVLQLLEERDFYLFIYFVSSSSELGA